MSPFQSFQNVMEAFLTGFLVLAPVAAGLAIVWRGLQFYFSHDVHKKSELKDTMTTYIFVTIVIEVAAGALRWIVGQI